MSEPEVTTVMVVDDSAVMRVGLRTLLEQDGALEVVGEAADGGGVAPGRRTQTERHLA